jgi:hypothetical protein
VDANTLKAFGMQNLMLEEALAKIEESGVSIGHAVTVQRHELVDVELFEVEIVAQARSMSELYILYYSLENSIRRLIAGRLRELHGAGWWAEKVPSGVRDSVSEKQKKERDTPLSIRSDDPLAYTNFGELVDILNANWKDFADTLRSQKAVQSTLIQFNNLRNVIAHSCYLNDDERSRLKLLIKDWFRIQT